MREEIGLELIASRIGPYTNDIFAAEGRHYITLLVLAAHVGGTPVLRGPDMCARWEWFVWDVLLQPLFLPIENLLAQSPQPLCLMSLQATEE